jgi:hypothetical protein
MKDEYLNIRIESDLKDQVIKLAEKERRSISDQTVCLIEQGLSSLRQHYELVPGYSLKVQDVHRATQSGLDR